MKTPRFERYREGSLSHNDPIYGSVSAWQEYNDVMGWFSTELELDMLEDVPWITKKARHICNTLNRDERKRLLNRAMQLTEESSAPLPAPIRS